MRSSKIEFGESALDHTWPGTATDVLARHVRSAHFLVPGGPPGNSGLSDEDHAFHLSISGVGLDYLDYLQVLDRIESRLGDTSQPLALASVNLDHLTYFASEGFPQPEQIGCAHRAIEWLSIADGWPISAWAQHRSGRAWPLLPGSDLLPAILELMNVRGLGLGVLGGDSEMHNSFLCVLEATYPKIRPAGFWAPTRAAIFDKGASRDVARQIREARVDVLLVGLGKPRQEVWIDLHGAETGARVLLAFGAAAEFLAGTRRRAPAVIRKARLEWLYRLIVEPRRLARRYLLQAPPALMLLFHSKGWDINIGIGAREGIAP